MFLSCLPGIEMTMLSPAVVTSDSATPKLSTRLRMIDTAWSSESWGTDPEPLVRRGVRMMLVPPSRSRPSRGWYFSPSVSVSLPILSGATTQISAKTRTVRTASTAMVRPGRAALAVAT